MDYVTVIGPTYMRKMETPKSLSKPPGFMFAQFKIFLVIFAMDVNESWSYRL